MRGAGKGHCAVEASHDYKVTAVRFIRRRKADVQAFRALVMPPRLPVTFASFSHSVPTSKMIMLVTLAVILVSV